MKVIHVMTNNLGKSMDELSYEFGKLSLLTAFLSVLKWKSYGFTVKLYVDADFKEYFNKFGLLDIYDEVDDSFLDNSDEIYENKGISKTLFWSFSKLFVLENEKEPVIISDMDFVPFEDYHKYTDEKCFAYYKEHLSEEYYPTSPNKYLELKPNYTFPEWYNWKCNPYNCAVLYVNDSSLKKLYLDQAYNYAQGIDYSLEERTLTNNIHVLFAEQKIINICAEYLGIDIKETIIENGSMFINEAVCHLSIYKMIDNQNTDKANKWILAFLEKIYYTSRNLYDSIINLEWYREYREMLVASNYDCDKPIALKLVNW